ncbi:MAG TPA: sodium:proton antiporter [Cyclobacteriaceae bacterium]|jgi:CPA1 family monovalent cation:H+ antiporter
MDVLDFITLLIIMAAFFTLVNVKYLKLPSTIGLMILALCLSLFIIFGELVFKTLNTLAQDLMTKYNFSEVLFKVMLSFLLFAGAIEMDLRKLKEEKWVIGILAVFGTLISTFVVGYAMYFLLPLVNIQLELIHCLLFGALISPTDPIAVLAMIKKSHVSKNLESQIAGESLFNDGIGVVIFLTILSIAFPRGGLAEAQISAMHVAELFGVEVVGGILLGAAIGYVGRWLLVIIDNEHTEIEVLVTLSMVLGGASLAEMLHVSMPLSTVVMGIFVGEKGRGEETDPIAGEYVYKFWSLMDEAMNAILFILIGLQVIVINWELGFFVAAGIAIIIVLLARFIGVSIPISIIRTRIEIPKYTIRILTWSGLRGGISVALALSLYDTAKEFSVNPRIIDLIISMTYSVVLFSILVQGLTVGKLFAKANPDNGSAPTSEKPEVSDHT